MERILWNVRLNLRKRRLWPRTGGKTERRLNDTGSGPGKQTHLNPSDGRAYDKGVNI